MATIIQSRFDAAHKLFGNNDEITTASGVKVRGRYILCESGVVTPSHNPLDGFRKSEDFPLDDNGQTVNDRDYERDTDAQRITRTIAADYDSRALQTPVVVTKDGIVLSGNGRTMAGILAAKDNTDAAYISYLKSYPEKYGFNVGDFVYFAHPRLLFLVDDDFPYNADTFAMFNAQEIKSQSKTEQAVKMGKLVTNETFQRIIRNINQFDTIGDFYGNTKAATEAINDLRDASVISQMQYPEMFDGDSVSQQAREILENVLIGKAFSTNPDAVRQITAYKGVRKNIITALAEISNNIALGEYSLESEMAQAIDLMYQARSNGGMAHGDIVSGFARQMTMFGATTIADFRNTTVLMLADLINSNQVTKLKRIYAVYNHQAQDAASGQTDMFSCGAIKTKKEILDEVCKTMNYGTKTEIFEQIAKAVESRKKKAMEEVEIERAKQLSSQAEKEKSALSQYVGKTCGLNLPSGEMIPVVLEMLKGNEAGVRLKGFYRCFVPEELVSPLAPSLRPQLMLPKWLQSGTVLSNGKAIEKVSKKEVTFTDGSTYELIDLLLSFAPKMKNVA